GATTHHVVGILHRGWSGKRARHWLGRREPDDTLRAPRFAAPASQISLRYRPDSFMSAPQSTEQSATQSAGERELAELIVTALNLEGVAPGDIDPRAPLFKTGLALDSIDALELALEISKRYGFQ